jgi:hypothetical protein
MRRPIQAKPSADKGAERTRNYIHIPPFGERVCPV